MYIYCTYRCVEFVYIFRKVQQQKMSRFFFFFLHGKWEKKIKRVREKEKKKNSCGRYSPSKAFWNGLWETGVLPTMTGFSEVAQMFDGNKHNSQRRCNANQTNTAFVLQMFCAAACWVLRLRRNTGPEIWQTLNKTMGAEYFLSSTVLNNQGWANDKFIS